MNQVIQVVTKLYPWSLEVTIYLWKGHLTIPKGAQRIARCFRFLWYCLKIYPCSCFIHIFNHDTFLVINTSSLLPTQHPKLSRIFFPFQKHRNPKIPLESSHGLHLTPPSNRHHQLQFFGVRGSQSKLLFATVGRSNLYIDKLICRKLKNFLPGGGEIQNPKL